MYRRSYRRTAEGSAQSAEPPVIGAPKDEGGFETHRVSFSPRLGSQARVNSYHLVGKGEFGVGDRYRIRGRSRRPFTIGKPFDLTLGADQIVNASIYGRGVRFEIVQQREDAKRDFVTLWFRDERTAAAVVSRLPQTQTPEFAEAQRDLSDFNAKLAQVTPSVVVTPALLTINILVFGLMVASGAGLVNPNASVHVRWGSNFGPYTLNGEWWRLLTATFIHFGVAHLALNMWALYETGKLVERLYGPLHFLVLYIGAGVAGGITSVLWNPSVNSAGASGAIFGVFGGLLVYMFSPSNHVPVTVMRQHRVSTAAFIFFSLANGFAHTGIDNAAHLGGLAAGGVLGLALARPLDLQHRAARGWWRFALVAIAAPLVLAAPLLATGKNEKLLTEMRYREDVAWFVKEEKELLAELIAWQKAVQQRAATEARLANRLDSNVVARWENASRRLARNKLPADSPLHQQQTLLLQYAEGRRDGFQLMVEAIRTRDSRKQAQAEATLAQSNAALAQLNQLNTK